MGPIHFLSESESNFPLVRTVSRGNFSLGKFFSGVVFLGEGAWRGFLRKLQLFLVSEIVFLVRRLNLARGFSFGVCSRKGVS